VVAVVAVATLLPVGCGRSAMLVRQATDGGAGDFGSPGTGAVTSLPDHDAAGDGGAGDGHGWTGAPGGSGGVPGAGGAAGLATITLGGAGGTAGAVSGGAGGAGALCLGLVRESGVVPFAIGTAGTAGASGATAEPEPCEPNPCKRGTACIVHQGRALCDCDPGTFGNRCERSVKAIASTKANGGYCAILTDDTVICWGSAEHPGTAPSGAMAAVSAGYDHNCAIDFDHELTCWDKDTASRPVPSGDFTAVAVSGARDCALRTDGTVACWNESGALAAPAGRFTGISLGPEAACGIRDDQTVTCWEGEFPDGAEPPRGTFVAVDVGSDYGCALGTDGRARCWGLVPEQGPGFPRFDMSTGTPDTQLTQIALVNAGACGIRTDGTVECWGAYITFDGKFSTIAGTCGIRTDGSFACADHRPPGDCAYTAVAVAGRQMCAIRANGTLACMSYPMARGEHDRIEERGGPFRSVSIGNPTTCALSGDGAPTCWSLLDDRPTVEGTWLSVAADHGHFCAIRDDCTLTCRADYADDHGAATPPSGSFSAITSGQDFSCGIRTDQTLACWGLDDAGQASPPAGTFVALAAGNRSACAIRTDGTLACWGEQDARLAAAPAGTFAALAADYQYYCGIRTDGTVACWGSGFYAAAPPDGTFAAIATGCGIRREDLRLQCWGGHWL